MLNKNKRNQKRRGRGLHPLHWWRTGGWRVAAEHAAVHVDEDDEAAEQDGSEDGPLQPHAVHPPCDRQARQERVTSATTSMRQLVSM